MKAKYFIAVVLVGVIMSVSLAFAQAPTGTVVGRVLDPSGSVVPDAKITLRSLETNQTRAGKTGSTGEYTVPGLLPGNYEVTVEKTGFKQTRSRLELAVDQVARFDATLNVGGAEETVIVTAEVPLINTETATRGAVVPLKEIAEIPLNGRNFDDLVFTVAGVAPQEDGGKGSAYVANGTRPDAANIVIDGMNDVSVRDATAQYKPPLDALEEFKVETSSYTAESGRMAGAVVNMQLKRGTNQLHGSLYEFARNDMFDAWKRFDDPAIGKSKLRQNQFGGTLGGPVRIPRLYNGRDRTFFFIAWETQRIVNGKPIRQLVPTDAELSGDFSKSVDANGKPIAPIIDPLTKKAFPGGRIDPSRFDPAIKALLAFANPVVLPHANSPLDTKNNYHAIGNSVDNYDKFVFKVDHSLTAKDTITFEFLPNFATSRNPTSGSGLGNFGSTAEVNDKRIGIRETHTFTNALINDFGIGLTRTTNDQRPILGNVNYAALLGIPGLTSDPNLVAFPQFKLTGYATLGDSTSNPIVWTLNNYDLNDKLTWVKGLHTLTIGGQIMRNQYFQPTNTNFNGTFTFKSSSSVGTGYVPADFLLGILNSSSRTSGTVTNHLYTNYYSAFISDAYKVRPNLTLNLGIRYEIQMPTYEKDGLLTSYVKPLGKVIMASTPNNMAALFAQNGAPPISLFGTATDNGLPFSLVNANYKNFAPRVGFAWRPFGNRTVVNGGYGIYYTGSRVTALRTDLSGSFPFSNQQSVSQTKNATDLVMSNPFPAALIKQSGVTSQNGWDPNAPSAYLQSWNFGVEREIGKGMAVQVVYNGSKGTHLGRKLNINQQIRYPDGTTMRPVSNYFNTINVYTFDANSVYHGGTVTVKKEFSKSLSFRANYTFSKGIDDASGFNYSGNGGQQAAQNSFDLRAERGRSETDRRHNFSANLIYQTPFHNLLLRGWQISGMGRAYSGAPFTVLQKGTTDQGEPTRPDRVCNGKLDNPTVDMWFNTNCFVVVPTTAYRFGNSGRDILDGPGYLEVATGFSRNFHLSERSRLQFRWEIFDILNHPNLKMPSGSWNDITSKSVGAITSSGDPRVMQFAAKYVF